MWCPLPVNPSPLRAVLPALLLALASASIALAATLAAPRSGEMAVVFPPFTDELTAWSLVREAGGLIVGPTRATNIVVAYAPDDDFQNRMRQSGALFFVAAKGLCASVSPSSGTS